MKGLEKKLIRLKNSNTAVSEVLGTILLLGVAVSLFSTLYYITLSEPLDTYEPYPKIVASIEGNNIIFKHCGGDELTINSEIRIDIGNGSIPVPISIGQYLADINEDDKWNIGEIVAFPFTNFSFNNPEANVTSIDIDGKRIILEGTLDIYPEVDIGVVITIDKENPKIGDYINITITVNNYKGDIGATGIIIKYILSEGLRYDDHNPSNTAESNYDNDTGLWYINKSIPVRDSVSLVIRAEVIGLGGRTEPTQLAMVLDGSGSIESGDWNLMKTGLAAALRNVSIFPHSSSVELTVVQFGGDKDWDYNWDDTNSRWFRDYNQYFSGAWSACSDNHRDGDFICDELDTSDASSIYVDFYYRLRNTEDDDLILYYYDGNSYNYIVDLGINSEDTWHHYTETITDPQYFVSDFQIRFDSSLERREIIWIDDVLIQKDTTILIDDGFEMNNVGYSQVEIGPIIVTNEVGTPGYYGNVSYEISVIEQLKGWTPMGCGIRLAADQLHDFGNFSNDKRQVICLVTDGNPNCEWIPGTYNGIYQNYAKGKASAEAARTYLLGTLETTVDQDEFDSLAVGPGPDVSWLNESIIWPEPGYQWIDVTTTEPPGPGWVTHISGFNEFEVAIKEMFRTLFGGIENTVELMDLDPRDPNSKNNKFELIIVPQD